MTWGIVTESDRQVTWYDPTWASVTRHDETKVEYLALQWEVLMSGDDISSARSIAASASTVLERDKGPHPPPVVQRALREAFKTERDRMVEQRILGRIGYTREKFIAEGHALLGDSEFARLNKEIGELTVRVSLLAYGFYKGWPYLFRVEDPAEIYPETSRAYAAIGTGTQHVWGALAPLNKFTSMSETMCRVYEAKFLAEQDSSVGKETHISVLQPGGMASWYANRDIEAVRESWEKTREHPPHDMLKIITETLGEDEVLTSEEVAKIAEKSDENDPDESPPYPESFGSFP
jgi:hypothetical protein